MCLIILSTIIFGSQLGYKVLNGNTSIGFDLAFQFFQLFIGRTDIESVKDGPVQIEPYIDCLIVYSGVLCNFSGSTGFRFNIIQISGVSRRKVQFRQISGIPQRCIILADLLFIMYDA